MVPLIVLTVVICFLDTYRHREGAFLGNLGVGTLLLAVIFVAPALIGEVALRLIEATL
jgi:multisubunit Na+/H+ antiporter MnhG subunit